MQLTAPAILLAARAHGETAVIARMLTEQHGMVAAYVAGGRGRQLRPVVIPGNVVQAEIRAKSDSQLPFARLEGLALEVPGLQHQILRLQFQREASHFTCCQMMILNRK